MINLDRLVIATASGAPGAGTAARTSPLPALPPVIEIEPPQPRPRIALAPGRRFGPDAEERATRPGSEERGAQGRVTAAAASVTIGFAAQHISQERLGAGLTIEPYAHAAAAYRRAGSEAPFGVASMSSEVMLLV